MTTYYANGSETASLTTEDFRAGLAETFAAVGMPEQALLLPPDFTRFYSRAGELTVLCHEMLGDAVTRTSCPRSARILADDFRTTPANVPRSAVRKPVSTPSLARRCGYAGRSPCGRTLPKPPVEPLRPTVESASQSSCFVMAVTT